MEDVALTTSILADSNSSTVHDYCHPTNLSSHNNFSFGQNFKIQSTALVEFIKLNELNKANRSSIKMQNKSSTRPNIITVSETSVPNKLKNTPSLSRNQSLPVEIGGKSEPKKVEPSAPNVVKRVKLTSRLVFLKVGQIDTRNERFDAEAFIECSWEDDVLFKILADPNMAKNINGQNSLEYLVQQAETISLANSNLVNLKNIINNINLLEYDPNLFWSPQLYIENAIGDLKEEIRHRLEIVEKEGSNLLDNPTYRPKNGEFKELFNNLTVRVSEMRKLRGVFYERLELYDFPMDTQELSITLTSKRKSNEVEFIENIKDGCSINTEDFLDQQEWDLFSHVKTTERFIYDPWRKYERTGFTISCYIARKPGYYLYNAYMLIFLITMLGFVPFAFDSDKPQFRCQVTGLLLLTSVNFRWVITQRLPSVPYLTSLDKYAIGSLLYLVLFCVWHSIIGSNIITSDGKQKEDIDHYVLVGSISFCFIYNLCYLVWFLKMSKSIKKFQSEGLKDAADQTKKRNKLNNKEIETTLTIDEQNDYEILKKCVKKELNTNKNVTKVSNSNPNLSRSNRLISQPSTNDPSLLITTA